METKFTTFDEAETWLKHRNYCVFESNDFDKTIELLNKAKANYIVGLGKWENNTNKSIILENPMGSRELAFYIAGQQQQKCLIHHYMGLYSLIDLADWKCFYSVKHKFSRLISGITLDVNGLTVATGEGDLFLSIDFGENNGS
jgi:hypothetical protein